jgi:hypothetical protein
VKRFVFLCCWFVAFQNGVADEPVEKGPRPIFTPYSRNFLDVTKSTFEVLPALDQRILSENKDYFYSIDYKDNANRLIIHNDKEYLSILTVEGYEYRPISAKWINAKLLYIEVFFNPHFGAYWIFDVESEKVVIFELQNDGVQAWQQEKESKKQLNPSSASSL